AQSPLHYRTSKLTPSEETDCMRLGTATHCAILEPERFAEIYAPAPEGDKRSKAVKEAWAEIEASGRIPLSHNDFEAIEGMKRSIMEHPLAGRWLTGGTAELSGYWLQHVHDGSLNLDADILCKCRMDYVKELGSQYVIIDLKTTKSAEPRYFGKAAYWDYQYHISAAHYLTGMEKLRGVRAQGFIFVTVEKTPPYAVNVFEASEEFIRAGVEVNRELYTLFASCQSSGNWPGYPVETKKLLLPRGAKQA
ncbi:MAG: PD-(D/E)XK nuclease-like domain-containing protein, partial [Synergistaceae bacterium]|nr:PD-(D/E)XK nuclease-like domain-containing protein [Synergistaceae bacterium]